MDCFDFERQVFYMEGIRVTFTNPHKFPTNAHGYSTLHPIPLSDDSEIHDLAARVIHCVGHGVPFIITQGDGLCVAFNFTKLDAQFIN